MLCGCLIYLCFLTWKVNIRKRNNDDGRSGTGKKLSWYCQFSSYNIDKSDYIHTLNVFLNISYTKSGLRVEFSSYHKINIMLLGHLLVVFDFWMVVVIYVTWNTCNQRFREILRSVIFMQDIFKFFIQKMKCFKSVWCMSFSKFLRIIWILWTENEVFCVIKVHISRGLISQREN